MNDIEIRLALAIGHAFNNTLAEFIPTRPSTDVLTNSSCRIALRKACMLLQDKIRKAPKENSPKLNYRDHAVYLETMAKRAVHFGVGNCDELIGTIMTFLGIYHVYQPKSTKIPQLFISQFCFKSESFGHTVAIIHDNTDWRDISIEHYQQRGFTILGAALSSFYSLFEYPIPLVVIDPWIREVCLNIRIEDRTSHMDTIKRLMVNQYYAGNVLKLRYTIPIRFNEIDLCNLSIYHNNSVKVAKYREKFHAFWSVFNFHYVQHLIFQFHQNYYHICRLILKLYPQIQCEENNVVFSWSIWEPVAVTKTWRNSELPPNLVDGNSLEYFKYQ